MEFFTSCKTPRPVRLPENVRQWAWDSLHGKYGDEAVKQSYCVNMDEVEGFDDLSDNQKYDAMIRKIVNEAPVRICPEEMISGAATLGLAIRHTIPAMRNGEDIFSSVSHLTIYYERMLKEGMLSYREELNRRLADTALLEDFQVEVLRSMKNVVDCMEIWHNRYLEATKDTKPEIYKNLCQVPFRPARNFYEAVQALWFTFAYTRLLGNWPGIGRIDVLLGDYLKKDLADGTLTMEQAREILAHFFIKGCEWIQSDTPRGTGDAQHYQNIILGGLDEDGNEVTNEVSYLVLDVVEELAISDYPISIRVNENTPQPFLRRMAEVMRHGGGIVAVYNEKLVLDSLEKEGYSPREARTFANDGCWEVQIPGSTRFDYLPFDALQILNRVLNIDAKSETPHCENIEDVWKLFLSALENQIHDIWSDWINTGYEVRDGKARTKQHFRPTGVINLFTRGCLEKALPYYEYGPKYTVLSPHIGGAPDVGNSLYAIEKIVFEEKKISFEDLIKALQNNWEGYEDLRLYAKNKLTYYGNDSDESDAYTSRVLDEFAAFVRKYDLKDQPSKYIAGVSTFGRQVDWLPVRCAVAFGFRKGDILAANDSPTPGTDFSGATAIIHSYCKADLLEQTCGSALDVKLFPDTVSGENGIQALESLVRGFVALGGFFMQLDCVDAATLYAAQKDPAAYKTLSVRVSGWNARFVTLKEEWQNMIIERTAQDV